MSRGKRFESARRLPRFGLDKRNTRNKRGSQFIIKKTFDTTHEAIRWIERNQRGCVISRKSACRRLVRFQTLCLLPSDTTTARPARYSYASEASPSSRPYATACSEGIARPSAHSAASSSASSWTRSAAR
jgi:hypothetical protein